MSNQENGEKISSVSEQTEGQQVQINRSHHDAILMEAGPPALYQLNTERKYIDGLDRKVGRWTYGRRDRNKQNKIILMVGETGAGKTTMINAMINYLLEVKFEDEEFYQITEEKENQDQTQSQTSEVIVYEVFVEENTTSLTIIDTPGYGDTEGYEKDTVISEYVSRLFSDEDGIHYIDAVCFVMKASQNRLSGKERYIFHSILSLFGKDIEENIVFLFTQSDGGRPSDALNAIKTEEIPCRRDKKNQPVYFLFNNRQKEERDEECKHVYRSAWEMGERSIDRFLTSLEEKNRKSVKMTLNVLKERRQLEACVSNLRVRIKEKELKTQELTEIQEALKENIEHIRRCENFTFKFQKVSKIKIPITPVEVSTWGIFKRTNNLATSCSVCKETCHNEYGCWWVPFDNIKFCEVMKNGNCTVCTNKCHYSKHKKENQKYKVTTEVVSMTFDELKQKYEKTGEEPKVTDNKHYDQTNQEHEKICKEYQKQTDIEKSLNSDLEKIKKEKSDLLCEAYMTIMNLCKIALKADSAFTLQHLDFLIPRLKEEGKDEWIKSLEDLMKMGEQQKNKGALQYFKNIIGLVTGKK